MNNFINVINKAKMIIAGTVKEVAKNKVPVDTRELQRSIDIVDSGNKIFVKAGSGEAPYAPYVHEGTGLYGKRKKRIAPKEKGALAFLIGGKKVIVKSTKGQKANPFMTMAAIEATPKATRLATDIISQGVSQEIVNALKQH